MEKKMKQSRPHKKKKAKTWAEAITEALATSSTKILGVQEIHEKIVLYKIKDIKMTKQDEKVLKTMLAQSMNSESCPFYKVRDKPGYYALKDPTMYRPVDPDGSDVECLIDGNEDSNGSGNSAKRKSKKKGSPNVIIAGTKSQDKKKLIPNKVLSSNMAKRSNSYTGDALRKAQLLSRRRTSTPSFSNIRTRPHLPAAHRSRSINAVQKSHSNPSFNTRRSQTILDLETPSSILTNTRLKSIINPTTFSMLPTSYQYQLIQLLPEVDRVLDDNGVPRMTTTALNNEFFSQALQDWSTQLSEGEFTRETQARIMQEIAKERSKIAPWKEKFFEEYYGQKQELKRTRSRSHDATANLADLSYEAQLSKFHHLAEVVDATPVKEEKGGNEGDQNVIMVDSDSETEQDPDYVDNIPLARFAPKDSKPINRRKISKPFKRTVSPNPIFSQLLPKFKTSSTVRSHANFQVRDDVYRSDSEASDTGELSDSNSFHQHDESDEDDDGESSDGMMNLGDDNLMDVDDDSDSEDGENTESLATDHSYTKSVRQRSSDGREWRRPGLSKVGQSSSNNGSRSDQNRTLVLTARDNMTDSIQGLEESESSTSTSPELLTKRPGQSRPTFDSIVPAVEKDASKDGHVGVLFSAGLQPTVNTCYGESIIPRISATNGLLSSPITPTTVCTSTTPASQQAKNDKNMLPTKCHTSENAATLKSKKDDSSPSGVSPNSCASLGWPAVQRTTRSGLNVNAVATSTDAKIQPSLGCAKLKAVNESGKKEGPSSTFGTSQNLWSVSNTPVSKSQPSGSDQILGRTSPILSSASSESLRRSPVLGSPRGVKRAQPITSSSPVKKTRTLAEIKAQMKAKRAAAASGSPVRGSKSAIPPQTVGTKAPVKIAQPVFCLNPTRSIPANAEESDNKMTKASDLKAEASVCLPVLGCLIAQNSTNKASASDVKSDTEKEARPVKTEPENEESSQNGPGKIILKIKSEEGKKYSVKVNTQKAAKDRSSDSDDGDIIRKTRRLSQVISSSGESSDDFDGVKDSTISGGKLENYSMLSQLALPGSYGSKPSVVDHHSLLKRTQKSPVFGEPAFEGLGDISRTVTPLPTTSGAPSAGEGSKNQPFISDKPVIGFQDIPSCTALSSSSNTSTFIQPSPTISVAAEAQKYRSIRKGKSIVQMQQLARTNRITSDESEQADSDTEDDSTASMTSSAEDDSSSAVLELTRQSSVPQLRKRNQLVRSGKNLENGPSDKKTDSTTKDDSDCEDCYSSSSSDDKPVITECICSCKRLVLCKGCGAYTHEECLSSTKLCSLCV